MDVSKQERRVLNAAIELGRLMHLGAAVDEKGIITLGGSRSQYEQASRGTLDTEIHTLLIMLTVRDSETGGHPDACPEEKAEAEVLLRLVEHASLEDDTQLEISPEECRLLLAAFGVNKHGEPVPLCAEDRERLLTRYGRRRTDGNTHDDGPA